MIRFHRMLLTLLALTTLVSPSLAATSRMPYGSFLTRPVNSVEDFAQLLRQDRVVAQRFADHFGMSNDAIADYVEKHGRVVMIPRSGYYVEYFIDRNGVTHKHHKRLAPKHRVLFVNGTPILDMECGNPMTKTVPRIPEPPKPRVTQAPQPPAPKPRPAPPPVVEQPKPTPPPEVTEQPPVTPTPGPEVSVLPGPQVEYPGPAQPAPVTHHGRGFPFPLLLGGAAFIHHGEEGPSPVPPPPPPPPPPGPVIPESSSLALGIGGMGFILAWHRMRRGR